MKELKSGLKQALTTEWSLYIAFLANFCVKVGAIAGYTFGTLIVLDSYPPDQQSQADDAVSAIMSISNLLVVPLALLVGKALDRYPAWGILAANTIVAIGSLLLMYPQSRYCLLIGLCSLICFNIICYTCVSIFISQFYRASQCSVT